MLVLEHIAWNLPDGEPILKDITLTVPDGKLAVVTGPNGGGKTSLAKLIAGLEKPAAGRILLDGEDITGLDITQRAKKGVAYAFQQPVRFKGLSVRDLLELAAGQSPFRPGIVYDFRSSGVVCAGLYRPAGGCQPFRRRKQAY